MATFKEWKKNNKVMSAYLPEDLHAMAYLVAQAAYKAGEREGLKRGEELCKSAIKMRELIIVSSRD